MESEFNYVNSNMEPANVVGTSFKIYMYLESANRLVIATLAEQPVLLNVKVTLFNHNGRLLSEQMGFSWPKDTDSATVLLQTDIAYTHIIMVEANTIHDDSKSSDCFGVTVYCDDRDSGNDESKMPSNIEKQLLAKSTMFDKNGFKQFVENYKMRFGAPHPEFHMGSIQSALQLTRDPSERKLFALYLHHGGSQLTNVFCNHLLKDEHVLQLLEQYYVLFGWDLTYQSNRESLSYALIRENCHLPIPAIHSLETNELPALIIVSTKAIVIAAHTDLDELRLKLLCLGLDRV